MLENIPISSTFQKKKKITGLCLNIKLIHYKDDFRKKNSFHSLMFLYTINPWLLIILFVFIEKHISNSLVPNPSLLQSLWNKWFIVIIIKLTTLQLDSHYCTGWFEFQFPKCFLQFHHPNYWSIFEYTF